MRDIILDAQSIGFGVQSVGMALMSGMDMIPRPDIYCYSELPDGKKTLDYRHYITPILQKLGVNVRILKPVDLYEHILSWPIADRTSMIPVWFMGADGKRQPLNRQCTVDFKIDTVAKHIREYLGVKRLYRNTVRVWQGISIDEIKRTKKKGYSLFPESFRVNHLPFIGQYANITYPQFNWESYSREKIMERIFTANGIKIPPKSSCFFCPFHDIEQWYDLFIGDPQGWELACVLDDSIRYFNTPNETMVSGPFYLYEGLIALREIDFDKERAKNRINQLKLTCESGFCML
jgi:hypothetical protein